MMRKRFWIMIAFLCVLAAGCNSQEELESTQSPIEKTGEKEANESEKEASDSLQESPPLNEEATSEAQVDSYQVETALYQSGKLTIQYPQLTGIKDKTREQQINEFLKTEAIKYVTQYADSDSPLNMEYQVTMNTQDTLSILYTGDYFGGMYPTHLLFTTNLNIQSGEKLRLSDVASINEEFIDQFKKSPYIDREQPSSPIEEKKAAVIEYLNSFNQEQLIKSFKQADDPSFKQNLYGIYSYFQEDNLIVSIQVPHALGDHAEFKMNVY